MAARELFDAWEEVAHQIGVAPPLAEYKLRGRTRLTGRWTFGPLDESLRPLNEVLVAAMFDGDGTAVANIGGERFNAPCTGGTLTVIPRGQDSHWNVSSATNVSHAYIGHDRLRDFADQVSEGRAFDLLARVNHPDSKLFAIMQLINHELEHPQHHSLLFMEHALDALCLQLIRSHSTASNPVTSLQHGLAHWQVVKVTTYIRENIGASISLQDLADVIGLSRFHFCSAFREATGHPPYEYLTRQRIKAACDLLKDRRLPVRSIALRVGYSTPSAFSATFHKLVGITPRQYRRES